MSNDLRSALCISDLIFITGLPSVGKTTLAIEALEEKSNCVYAYIHCADVALPSQLLLKVRDGLKNSLKLRKFDNFDTQKTDIASGIQDFKYFFELFKNASSRKGVDKVFIVFDGVEFFRKTSLMDCLLVFMSIRGLNVVLISNEDLHNIMDFVRCPSERSSLTDRAFVIDIPAWSKTKIIECILKQKPAQHSELYEIYVNNVVNLMYNNYTKDFVELRSYCQQSFGDYVEYYNAQTGLSNSPSKKIATKNQINPSQTSTIIMSFMESLKTTVREKSTSTWKQIPQRLTSFVTNTSTLIVSAYIASNTTTCDDKKNFIQCQKKRVVGSGELKDDFKAKSFTLERLIHICRRLDSLLTPKLEKDDPNLDFIQHANHTTDSILTDIALLEELGIIRLETGDGLCPLSRYQIATSITKNCAEQIAQSINLELDQLFGLK